MKYGYARVSTDDQTTALQLAALKKAGCKPANIFEEKVSGVAKRPALVRCLKTLQPGDTLIVWKLDRLGRGLVDLVQIVDGLRDRRVKFQSITQEINSDTPGGRLMMQIFAMLAEFERATILERTAAGRVAAKARGVKFGAKPKLSPAQLRHARELVDGGRSPTEVAQLVGVSRATLYRALAVKG